MAQQFAEQQVTLGMIGLGRMAQALVAGLIDLTDPRLQFIGHDPHEAACDALRQLVPPDRFVSVPDNRHVAEGADVVVLAVKPHHAEIACREMAPSAPSDPPLVLSMMAGVQIGALAQWLGHDRIIRVMPNTPCLVQRGAGAYASGPGATDADRSLVARLLHGVGSFHAVSESALDAVTGLSGSGPAFVFVLIEALADAGVAAGLTRPVALDLAARTVEGAATMVRPGGEHPAELKDRVASPGGTTIAGLEALEQRGGRAGIMAAVAAAATRSAELGATRDVDP